MPPPPPRAVAHPLLLLTAATSPLHARAANLQAPLVLYADSTPNPLSHRAAAEPAACPHGLNAATGYCYLHANASAVESCTCSSCQASENLFHLSPMGLFFTIFCTYSGFVLLAVAVMWNANLHKKLAQVQTRWRELRARM